MLRDRDQRADERRRSRPLHDRRHPPHLIDFHPSGFIETSPTTWNERATFLVPIGSSGPFAIGPSPWRSWGPNMEVRRYVLAGGGMISNSAMFATLASVPSAG